MSGIFEQMQQAIGALMNDVNTLKQQVAQLQQPVPQQTPPPQFLNPNAFAQPQQQFIPQQQQFAPPPPAAPPQQQFAPPTPTAPQQHITDKDVMALITPYLDNQQAKDAFKAALGAMGVGGLPELQPHQYGEAYNRCLLYTSDAADDHKSV
jgi:hypothetical protein